MGNAWYCKKCEEGKIALSNTCAEKFINEETGIDYTSEERWMNKLRCLDDEHSKTHGLTIENFDKLAGQIENHCKDIREVPCKNRESVSHSQPGLQLIACLKKYPDCMIKCMEEMENFIDCVDEFRINIIKSKIEQARKSAKKEEIDQLFNS